MIVRRILLALLALLVLVWTLQAPLAAYGHSGGLSGGACGVCGPGHEAKPVAATHCGMQAAPADCCASGAQVQALKVRAQAAAPLQATLQVCRCIHEGSAPPAALGPGQVFSFPAVVCRGSAALPGDVLAVVQGVRCASSSVHSSRIPIILLKQSWRL